jgi:hypothetical protein
LQSTKEDNVMSNIKTPPEGGVTTIPMSPAELPQQKLYEVKGLPILPDGCAVEIMNYEREHTLTGIPKKPTKKSIPLGQIEWSWSPMNARVDSYELHKGKEHWLLWCGGPDDNASTYISNWYAAACIAVKGVSQEQAAVHLLLAFWEYETACMSLDRYHWINWSGALSVSDIQSIANEVWPED